MESLDNSILESWTSRPEVQEILAAMLEQPSGDFAEAVRAGGEEDGDFAGEGGEGEGWTRTIARPGVRAESGDNGEETRG